jgi:hypothetical protein
MAEKKDAFNLLHEHKRRKLDDNNQQVDEEKNEEDCDEENDEEALLYISTMPTNIQNAINYDNVQMNYIIQPVDVLRRNVSLDSFCHTVVKSNIKHDDFSNTVRRSSVRMLNNGVSTTGVFTIKTKCENMFDKKNLKIIFSLNITLPKSGKLIVQKDKVVLIASPKEFEPGEWDLTNDTMKSSYKTIEAISKGNQQLFEEGFAVLMRRISQVLLGKNRLFLTSLVVLFTN